MLSSVNDLHLCRIGQTDYWFRTAGVHDPARMRHILKRQRVRRPSLMELRVAARAGVEQMAALAGEAEEGERQAALLARWYDLQKSVDEDEIDEADFEKRAAILAEREQARLLELQQLWPEICAIEANLERHHPPYAELVADREYWDDVSRIEIVRLLLVRQGEGELPRDDADLLTAGAYRAIPIAHRVKLATFAFGLLAPAGEPEKN